MIVTYLVIGGDLMNVIYDDAFIEILDRLVLSGLEEHEACMLLACFLQEQKEKVAMVIVFTNSTWVQGFVKSQLLIQDAEVS